MRPLIVASLVLNAFIAAATPAPTSQSEPPTSGPLKPMNEILSFLGSQTDPNKLDGVDVGELLSDSRGNSSTIELPAYFKIAYQCSGAPIDCGPTNAVAVYVSGVQDLNNGNPILTLSPTYTNVLRLTNFSSGSLTITHANQSDGAGPPFALAITQNPNCPDNFWPCATAQTFCCPCPAGATCVRGKSSTAMDGWIKVDNSLFLQCSPDNACVNDDCVNPPYTNRLGACNTCVEGYFRKDQACVECPSTAGLVLAVGVIFFLVVLLFILKFSKASEVTSFSLQISLGFIQLISIYATLPFNWPSATNVMFDVLSFTNFNVDLFSPECAISGNYWSKWVLKMMLPVIAAGVFLLLYLLVRCVPGVRSLYIRWVLFSPLESLREKQRQALAQASAANNNIQLSTVGAQYPDGEAEEASPAAQKAKLFLWEEQNLSFRFVSAMTMCAAILYTFLAKTTTDPLNCIMQTDGSLFIKADPSVLCYDSAWTSHAVLIYLGLFVYVFGIPAFFFLVLFRAFRTDSFDSETFFYRYGLLMLPYRDQFWYWELMQTGRKLVTVLLVNFGAGRALTSTTQINGLILVLLLFLAAQEFVKPYQLAWCNRVAFSWTVASVLVLVSALLFQKQVLTSGQEDGYAAGLIVACVVAEIVTIICFIKEKKHARDVREELRGVARLDKEREERRVLLSAFGPEVGPAMFRRARGLSARHRTLFIRQAARIPATSQEGPSISGEVQSSPEVQRQLVARFGPRAGRILASSLDRDTQQELLKEQPGD